MAQTVTANGLTISHKGTAGFQINSTPDVCKTPAGTAVVPVPYIIIARSSTLSKGTKKVKADGGNSIAHRPSVHARCNGDEPGTLKGVISNTNMHQSHWITFSPTVYAEGKNISRLSDKMFMNNRNCISGVGGHFEIPMVLNPLLFELCQIFCQTREDWHKDRRAAEAGGPRAKNPSGRAEKSVNDQLADPNSNLNGAIQHQEPGGFGAAEKLTFGKGDSSYFQKHNGRPRRKPYNNSQARGTLTRQVDRAGRKGWIDTSASSSGATWKRTVPGLGVVDGLDNAGSYTGSEVKSAVKGTDIVGNLNGTGSTTPITKVKPDFMQYDANGKPTQAYDFKFDDPDSKPPYKDKFQTSKKQAEAYEAATGNPPIAVDVETCGCERAPDGAAGGGGNAAGPSTPSAAPPPSSAPTG